MGEGVRFGAGVRINGGAGGEEDFLLAVFTAEADFLEVTVGGGGGEDGCYCFWLFLVSK